MAGSAWRSLPFGEAVEINPSVPLERGKAYPFVDMQAVNPSSRAVGPSEYREFEGGGTRFATGDTLMARITPCLENGKIAQFHVELEHAVGHGSTEFIVIRGRDGVTDNDFVYYLTRWDGVRGYAISQMTGSSGRQRVPTEALASLEVMIPLLPEQRGIAHILGTLDDKIELNRRMNETLEAMARALFKSWFVDFDPVRAKAEGCDPGLPKPIADLFPDRLVASELGGIPQGWVVKAIGELAAVVGGSTPSTKDPRYWNDGAHHWATPKDLSGLSVPVLLDTERCITDAGLSQISSGLLPKGTVLLSSRAPIGYLAVAEVPVAINQGFIAMKPKNDVSNIFLLLWASIAHEDIISRANGSTFLEISKANFRPITLVAPTTAVMKAFDAQVRPLYHRIVECAHESRTLAALRNALLPKLISGEIRIKNVEKFVGARS